MRLPTGYVSPETVYTVVSLTEDDRATQHGTFDSDAEAQKLFQRLRGEGVAEDQLFIMVVPVYRRLQDYDWDQ